jgi:regulatory protein
MPTPAPRRRDAFEAALGALNRRDRTVAELVAWLEEREYGAEEIEDAVERLIEAGGLDDARYARIFAEDKRALAGWGPERIGRSLAERGIEAALIEEVCGLEDHGQQVERAAELLDVRDIELDDDRGRTRALGFLTRRGYEYEVAYEAIRSRSRAA